MAHVLNIVYGSTTITLASGAYSLLSYIPRAPTSLEDDATISEPCKIEISGASVAALQTALQAIELAFRQAERYRDTQMGDRVYIVFTPDGYSDAYQSELLTGKPDFDNNTLDDRWVEKKIDVTLNWVRRFYWEGPETQATVSNSSGSGTIITLYNHDDAGHDNYLEIAAGAITGDLPTPPRLKMYADPTNTGTNYVKDLYIGHNALSDPAGFAHILEGESGITTVGANTADATCSNGSRKSFSWAATTETELAYWTLTQALLNSSAGGYFRVLARFSTAPAYTNLWLRLQLTTGLASNILWRGPLSLCPQQCLVDLGVVQLPPMLPGQTDINSMALALYGKRNTAGTHTLELDFLQLTPLDSWRTYRGKFNWWGNGSWLMDDGPQDLVYWDFSIPGVGKMTTHTPEGQKINLIPGLLQRLYFLHSIQTLAAPTERMLNVSVWYRPRRTTL